MLDGVDWVASFLAALRIGAVPVPMSTMLTGPELAFQCNDARARVVIASAALGAAVKEMQAACDELENLVIAGDGEAEVGIAGPVRVHRFDEWTGGQPTEATPYATWPDSPAFWLYTSGTTGKPKAAMHRHIDLPYTAETYGQQVLGITPSDRCSSRCRPSTRRCWPPTCPPTPSRRCAWPSPPASRCRQASTTASRSASASTSSTASAPPRRCTSSSPTVPTTSGRARPARWCPVTRSAWWTTTARLFPMAPAATCWSPVSR